MSISPISAAGLSQYVLESSNSTQLKQAFQSLQNSLASGDLTGAQSAFQTLQTLFQNAATASGSSLSSNSQLSTDLTALGNALTSGEPSHRAIRFYYLAERSQNFFVAIADE